MPTKDKTYLSGWTKKPTLTGNSGGVGDNALSYLNQWQVSSLTPEARQTLSRTPVTINPNLSTQNRGAVGLATGWIGPFGFMSPRISLMPTAQGTNVPLHESLHVLDNMYGGLSKNLVNTPETRKKLSAAYYSGSLRNPNFGSESHISPFEAYAQAGMNGWNAVPPEMRSLYSRIFLSPGAGGNGWKR